MRKGGKRLQLTPLAAPPREKGGKRLQRTRPSVLPKQRGGKRLRIQQRRTHGKPRGVMASAILLAVSVAVVAGVTFGWYDLFRETQASAVVLKSEGQNVNVDGFTLFTYEDEESGISADKTTITLKSYDSVFGRNENTPVYILIPVSGEAVQQEGHTLEFVFDCGNNTLMDEDKIAPLFSNVAQLRCVTVGGVPTNYSEAKAQFSGVTDIPVCFASFTVDKNTHELVSDTKTSTVTLPVSGYSASRVIYVLFELDYNFELVTGFVDNYASGIVDRLDQTQNLQFNAETLTITVSAS